MMHTNAQAIENKVNSLKSIVNALQVNLVTINETHLRANDKLKVEGFKTFGRNRTDAAMGGVATLVRDDNASNVLKVSEGKDEEYVIT